jgi:hypothetical protein
MLATIAIILLILWGVGLVLHLFGAFIYILLVGAIILGIAHFISRGNNR